MNGAPPARVGKPAALRLVFSLDRDEDPRLYDDLVAMRKGVKRTARLRLLAHDGLLLQQGIAATFAAGHAAQGSGRSNRPPQSLLTNQVFGPPVDE